MVILRFSLNNLQSNVSILESDPTILEALITTVYVVLEVVIKMQFIVSLVTSLQLVSCVLFGSRLTAALSIGGMYSVDDFPNCKKGLKKHKRLQEK